MERRSRVSNPPWPRNKTMHRLGLLFESQLSRKYLWLLKGINYPMARTVSLARCHSAQRHDLSHEHSLSQNSKHNIENNCITCIQKTADMNTKQIESSKKSFRTIENERVLVMQSIRINKTKPYTWVSYLERGFIFPLDGCLAGHGRTAKASSSRPLFLNLFRSRPPKVPFCRALAVLFYNT